MGGVDYYLQEIRNVITSKEDVERLWPGARVEDIKMLTLDMGQACLVGAFVHLPHKLSKSRKDMKPVESEFAMKNVITTSHKPTLTATGQELTTMPVESLRSAFYNLAVQSKVVYQPNF